MSKSPGQPIAGQTPQWSGPPLDAAGKIYGQTPNADGSMPLPGAPGSPFPDFTKYPGGVPPAGWSRLAYTTTTPSARTDTDILGGQNIGSVSGRDYGFILTPEQQARDAASVREGGARPAWHDVSAREAAANPWSVTRSPEEVQRAQDIYNKTIGLYGGANARTGRGIADSLATRFAQKGYGYFGPDRSQEEAQSRAQYMAMLNDKIAAANDAGRTQAYAALPGQINAMQQVPDNVKNGLLSMLGQLTQQPATQQEVAPNWFQYNTPEWGTGNAANTNLQTLLGL
jgi:hypothetical protein